MGDIVEGGLEPYGSIRLKRWRRDYCQGWLCIFVCSNTYCIYLITLQQSRHTVTSSTFSEGELARARRIITHTAHSVHVAVIKLRSDKLSTLIGLTGDLDECFLHPT